jgi:hypothetical protein
MTLATGHVLTFDPVEHRYTLDGRSVPGATTIINQTMRRPELERWREWVGTEEADRIRDEAAEHGTLLHAAAAVIASDVEDIPFGMDPGFAESYAEFSAWFETNVDEVLQLDDGPACEVPVYEPTFWYAGTADAVLRLKGRKTYDLADWKTTWAVYPSVKMQTAAYRKAAQQMFDVTIGGRICVLVPRPKPGQQRPKLSVHRFDHHAADFNAFTYCLGLYRWQRGAN